MGKPDLHLHPSIRGLLVEKQIIFDRVTMTKIEIVWIMDGRQDLTKLFNIEDL
jgi:plasmid stabilization system protein ParE